MGSMLRGPAVGALTVARRLLGRREVNWTPDFMGFGNQLYLWCWAWERRDQRVAPKVLVNDRTRAWLPEVPAFAQRFLLERHQVHLLDRRTHAWAAKERISGFAQGFSPQARRSFIEDALAHDPLLAGARNSNLASEDVLTIVVRRGDFYSPGNREEFAFDIRGYVAAAVDAAIARDGVPQRIHVISDEQSWCRHHLAGLGDRSPLTFARADDTPIDNFREACASQRLIITNGTFCLWVAFISRTLHGQDPGLVWAPAFFQKRYGPGRCLEYDVDFSFVDTLASGWRPDWVLRGLPDPRDTG